MDRERTAQDTQSGSTIGIKLKLPLRIVLIVFAAVLAVILYLNFISRPFDKTRNTYSNITISEGSDAEDVAELLETEGIIADASHFRLASSFMLLTDFKPGTYYLSPSMNSTEIARTMVKGLTTRNGFTIPEGYTVEQTASALSQDGFADAERFLEAASGDYLNDIDFVGSRINGPEKVEGFLLPDKYTVDSDADETMLIIAMLDNFNNFFDEDLRARAEELGMSIREIVVIASIIEKETAVDREKPELSAVIHNRINLDLYKEGSIPEIPLCSPGRESIRAALYPVDNDNIYYVMSDRLDGTHVFTSDKDEYKVFIDAYKEAVSERDSIRNRVDQ